MYYCNPINIPYRYQYVKKDDRAVIYREAADPSLGSISWKILYVSIHDKRIFSQRGYGKLASEKIAGITGL